jgi:hypothetical protein
VIGLLTVALGVTAMETAALITGVAALLTAAVSAYNAVPKKSKPE